LTQPVNVRVTIGDSTLLVEPLGYDLLLTLRRRIEIPLGQVLSARVLPREDAPGGVFRFPGTHLPGVRKAGSYLDRDRGRVFWDVRRAASVVVVTCADGAPYRALVLEFAEPDLVAVRIQGALAH